MKKHSIFTVACVAIAFCFVSSTPPATVPGAAYAMQAPDDPDTPPAPAPDDPDPAPDPVPVPAVQADVGLRYVVEGLGNARQVGGYLVVQQDSNPYVTAVGMLTVEAAGRNIAAKARSSDGKPVEMPLVEQADDVYTYLIFGKGPTYVDAITVVRQTGAIAWDTFTLDIVDPREPDEPDNPDPGPAPDVPGDDFDNLGQRVAVWAKGLPSNAAWAAAYNEAATALDTDPTRTINQISEALVAKLKADPNYNKYSKPTANINADLQERWAVGPMAAGVLADYYLAVAAGYKGAK